MEHDVFLRPAVADLLKKNFVEARIHVDIPSHLTDEQFAANKALQRELAGTSTMPTYVMVDPASGRKLGLHQLSGSPAAYESAFTDFLQGFLH